MAKSFLGITWSLTPEKYSAGEKILQQMHNSDDSLIKKLSSTAINFIDEFVKPPEKPFTKAKTKK